MAYPSGKPVIDVADFEAEELVLSLEDETPFDQQFTNIIVVTRDRCTEGSNSECGKKTVQDNANVPVVLVKMLYFELVTKFLMQKKRMYVYAMTIKEDWHLCSDSPFAIMDGLAIGFDSSYQGKKVNNHAGPAALVSVLNVKSNEKTAWEKAFTSICLHFPEPSRFTAYENFIRDAMSTNNLRYQVEFTPKLQRMRTCWSALSDSWRLWCQTKTWKLDAKISKDLKIRNAEQLARDLAVLCP